MEGPGVVRAWKRSPDPAGSYQPRWITGAIVRSLMRNSLIRSSMCAADHVDVAVGDRGILKPGHLTLCPPAESDQSKRSALDVGSSRRGIAAFGQIGGEDLSGFQAALPIPPHHGITPGLQRRRQHLPNVAVTDAASHPMIITQSSAEKLPVGGWN